MEEIQEICTKNIRINWKYNDEENDRKKKKVITQKEEKSFRILFNKELLLVHVARIDVTRTTRKK